MPRDDTIARLEELGVNTDWPEPNIDLVTESTWSPPSLVLHDIFSHGWESWIEAAAEAKGAPPGYVAVALLSVAGALIGNARWANPWDGWAEPPIVNAALVGNPSAGKSPALDALTALLTNLEAVGNEDWGERRRLHQTEKHAASEHRAAWEKDVKSAVAMSHAPPMMPVSAGEPEPPQRRRILSTDPTVAKAERISAGNPRGMILVRDELAGWIVSMDRFNGGGGSDRAFWLQAYGGRHWTPDRVKDGDAEVLVPHLTWAVAGGIQPDRLATLFLSGDDDGLSARFIYTWPSSRPPTRPRNGLAVAKAREWLARLRSLPWTAPDPVLVPFSEAARVRLQAWREQVHALEKDASGLLLSWMGKLPGFAVRLSLILAYLTWCEEGVGDPPAEIGERDIQRAITFLTDYAIPMAQRCFGEAALPEVERDARQLARYLMRQQPLPVTINARELRRVKDGPGIKTSTRLNAALVELAGLGVVREASHGDNGRGGRLRADWDINPKLRRTDEG